MRTLVELTAFSIAGALLGLMVGIILVSVAGGTIDEELNDIGWVEHGVDQER